MYDGLFDIDVVETEELPQEIIRQSNEEVMKGDIFASESETIRIIDVREAGIMVIDLNTNMIRRIECVIFFEMVESGILKRQEQEIVKYVEISAKEMEKIKLQKKELEQILETIYPHWKDMFRKTISKPYFAEATKNLGVSEKWIRKIMLTYLRSGRDMYSLVDQRKFNHRHAVKVKMDVDPRKDTDLLYRTAMEKFKETLSIQAAYDYILRKYFREPVMVDGAMKMRLIPEEEITLSYFQVYDYIRKHLGGLTVKEYIKGEKEVRNNDRQLPGDVRYGVSKLGQCFEADECELPCYIVDEETGEVVGKAIMYVVAEVKSCAIFGCYVSYENNSFNGLRQVLLSMLEPHYNQTKKYGLDYTEEEFPSMVVPDELRCDHGAEYESHAVIKALGEMGIRITHVPVACGSAKGLVESINNQVQIFLKNYARNAGVIQKGYRGGDIAKGNACLTLEDLREIVYRCVLYINNRARPGYIPDAEQMKAGIGTSPAAVYTFEKKRSGDPRNVNDANRDRYLYSLIAKEKDKRKFSIDKKEGIRYSGHLLRYYTKEPWFTDMLHDEKHLKDIEVRYDENNIGCVYVCYKNIVHKVPLSELKENQKTFVAASWEEYDCMEKEWKNSPEYIDVEEKSKNKKLELQDEIEKKVEYAKTFQGAGPKYGKAKKEDRAKAREKAKKDQNEITNRMYENVGIKQDDPVKAEIIETEISKKTPVVKKASQGISHKDRPRRKSFEEECRELASLLVKED